MLRRRMMMAQGGVSLPAGYTKIEYLESDGTQFIDTGFKPNQDTRVICDYLVGTKPNTSRAVYGCTDGSKYYGVFLAASDFTNVWYNTAIKYDKSVAGRWLIDQNKNVATINGDTLTWSAATFQFEYSLFLFACNGPNVTYVGASRIYSFKIYDNGVLARDYVPCTNPIGVKGLWDAVNEEFYALTPTGYTRLAYLESDGSDYIDTDFKPNQDTRVVFEASLLSLDGDQYFYGAKDSGSTQSFVEAYSDGAVTFGYANSFPSAAFDLQIEEKIVIDQNREKGFVNGELVAIANTATFQTPCSLYLCARNNEGTVSKLAKVRIYSCKIYDNGVLVRDFIPCTNPDGISGLWDSVNDVFYKMLPADYTRLDFIESDGTTYIDTAFKPNNNTRVVFEGYNNSTSSGWIFGAWKAVNNNMFCASALKTYNVCYGTEIWANATMPVGPISIDINKNAYTYNGVSGTLSEQTFSCDYSMYLFHINAAGTVSTGSFNGRIYSCKIYDNGTLVRDFIPAMNASGEAGLYDIKNDVWYALKPVVTKKENKITLSLGKGPSVTLPDGSTIPTTTGRIVAEEQVTSNVSATIRSYSGITVANSSLTISKGSIRSTPRQLGFGNDYCIYSISPTEDDTYIYTF